MLAVLTTQQHPETGHKGFHLLRMPNCATKFCREAPSRRSAAAVFVLSDDGAASPSPVAMTYVPAARYDTSQIARFAEKSDFLYIK